MNLSISPMTTIGITISIFICFAVPFIALFKLRKKTDAKVSSFFIGTAIFILFTLILESILHYFVLTANTPVSKFLASNPYMYVLYASLAAGVFEETGRFVAFRSFQQRERLTTGNALMYGVGHGGTEAILLCGVTMVSNLVLVLLLSFMGTEEYLSKLPDPETSKAAINTFLSIPSMDFFLAGIERLFAMIFHVAMSLFVFTSAAKQGKKYLYPVAILLHTLLNIPAGLYQKGIIKNIYFLEIYIAIFATICFVVATKLITNKKETPVIVE